MVPSYGVHVSTVRHTTNYLIYGYRAPDTEHQLPSTPEYAIRPTTSHALPGGMSHSHADAYCTSVVQVTINLDDYGRR